MSSAERERLAQQQREWRDMLPELKALPAGWIIKSDKDWRIYYQNPDNQTAYDHPTLGQLPKPWIIRCCMEADGKRAPRYFHKDTKRFTKKDPRIDKRVLHNQNNSNKGSMLETTMRVHKMEKGVQLEDLQRQEISKVNFRNTFDILKVLDYPGKDATGERLMVEKRFKRKMIDDLGKLEIEMLHRLKHTSISFYLARFITPDNLYASVYVEFCDRGSLENLVNAFAEKRLAANNAGTVKPEMPERFIWHAFSGLCGGLAYLLGGCNYSSADVNNYDPVPGWIPILHRDIKPDNVLLRSRATVGTKRYFYCVLSDFGLACEDRKPGHPKENDYQKIRNKIGTKHYFAPELLYNPYPRQPNEFRVFPNGQKHTSKSDLYSLGAAIYNLADCGPTMYYNNKITSAAVAHISYDAKPSNITHDIFMEGTLSRKHPLDVSKLTLKKRYSSALKDAILLATRWDPKKRPDPIRMVMALKDLMEESGFTTHIPQGADDEELPNWATKVHDYHSLKPQDPGQIDQN